MRLGCGACHAVRGTDADGVVGPDLTHVGSRHSLGAGILDNDVQGFEKWLSRTHEVKPGVLMPTFDMVPKTDVHALASYLEELQ
jgi:cytochrome c oxidase subunit 2